MKEQYRNSGRNPRRTAWLRDTMRRDLADEIARGRFRCFGLRTEPDLSPGPEQIPSFLFSDYEAVNWDESCVSGFKRRYEDVRLPWPRRRAEPRPKRALDVETGEPTARERDRDEPNEVPSPTPLGYSPEQRKVGSPNTPKARRRGRPSVQPLLVAIVRELRDAGRLAGLMRKEQVDLVGRIARERHPADFPKAHLPSLPSVLKALKDDGSTPRAKK